MMKTTMAISLILLVTTIGLLKWGFPKEEPSYSVICLYPTGGSLQVDEQAIEKADIRGSTTIIHLHGGGVVKSTLPCTVGIK